MKKDLTDKDYIQRRAHQAAVDFGLKPGSKEYMRFLKDFAYLVKNGISMRKYNDLHKYDTDKYIINHAIQLAKEKQSHSEMYWNFMGILVWVGIILFGIIVAYLFSWKILFGICVAIWLCGFTFSSLTK